jgi:hypothetical protein
MNAPYPITRFDFALRHQKVFGVEATEKHYAVALELWDLLQEDLNPSAGNAVSKYLVRLGFVKLLDALDVLVPSHVFDSNFSVVRYLYGRIGVDPARINWTDLRLLMGREHANRTVELHDADLAPAPIIHPIKKPADIGRVSEGFLDEEPTGKKDAEFYRRWNRRIHSPSGKGRDDHERYLFHYRGGGHGIQIGEGCYWNRAQLSDY